MPAPKPAAARLAHLGSALRDGCPPSTVLAAAPCLGTLYDRDPLSERTVGVVSRDEDKVCPGYTLFTPFSRGTILPRFAQEPQVY